MATETEKTNESKKNGSVKPIPRWKLVIYYVAVGALGLGVVLFLQSLSV